jgi:WD40 repeat protein
LFEIVFGQQSIANDGCRNIDFEHLSYQESLGMDCYQKHRPASRSSVNYVITSLVLVGCAFAQANLGRTDEFVPRTTEGLESQTVSLIRLEPLDDASVYPPVVTAMATASHGKWLAAAGDDHAIRIVSLADGQVLETLRGHRDWVQSITILSEESGLLSCSKDGELRFWNPKEDWSSQVIHRGSVALMTLIVDQQKQYVACAGFGPNIWIYSLSDRSLVKTILSPSSDLRTLAFSNDGQELACGGRDGVIRVWSWTTDRQPLEQALHRDRIRAIRFSADGQEITSVGEDRRLVRYRHNSGQVVSDRVISTGRLLSMTFIDDETIAVAGSDNTIRILDINSSQERNKLIGHEGSIAVMNCNGTELISGSFDTTIRIWNLEVVHDSQVARAGRYEHPVSSRFQDSGISDGVK